MSAGVPPDGTIVVVGTGQAGFQAAASLREEGFGGRVVLIGEEPGLPYQRPPLSKAYLLGKASAELVRLRPETFFTDHRIDLRPRERVEAIDRRARQVVLARGERISYDHLVLAVGARNRALPVPGAALDGVHQLRTLGDAEKLRERLNTARSIVVVGAGFIGLEVAAVATALGRAGVTVIEAADRVMARSVSPLMSAHARAVHERLGVTFALNALVTRIHGRGGQATAVETKDGRRFPADLILVGIGVVPNTELAAAAGLAVSDGIAGLAASDGIAVDEHLLTSDNAISAIGDCALHPNRFAPRSGVRLESVQGAVDQARCVAARLAGRATPYASLPWFWAEQGPMKLQIAGITTPHEESVARGDPNAGGFSVFCFRGGRLAGVESANRPLDHVLARKLLASGSPLTPEQATDPSFDLRAYASQLV